MSEVYLGLDLGTYNSAVACGGADLGEVSMLQSPAGLCRDCYVFPSFIYFDALGEPREYGEDARRQWRSAWTQVVWGFKRLLRRSYADVADELARFRYAIEADENGWAVVRIGPRTYRPEQLYQLLLSHVLECVTDTTLNPLMAGRSIARTLVTVPAYYRPDQWAATREAAEIAGLPNVATVSEPVAAVMAYGHELASVQDQIILCVDWGAGTLDIVAGLIIHEDGGAHYQVLGKYGDPCLGGLDWDFALLRRVIEFAGLDELEEALEAYHRGQDVAANLEQIRRLQAMARLHQIVEDAKQDAGEHGLGRIPVPGRNEDLALVLRGCDEADSPVRNTLVLEEILTAAGILGRFADHLDFVINAVGGDPAVFDRLLLVGGPMNCPLVHDVLEEKLEGAPALQDLARIRVEGFAVHPMEAVARGAAEYALSEARVPSLPGVPRAGLRTDKGGDVVPHDYGVAMAAASPELDRLREMLGALGGEMGGWAPGGLTGQVLIERGSPLGTTQRAGFSKLGEPGDAVRIMAFQRTESATGVEYVAFGEFQFVPIYNGGLATYAAEMTFRENNELSLAVEDLSTRQRLQLRHLDQIPPHHIEEPRPPGQDTGDDEREEPEVPWPSGKGLGTPGGGGGGVGLPSQPGSDRQPGLVAASRYHPWRTRALSILRVAEQHQDTVAELAEPVRKLRAALEDCERQATSEGCPQDLLFPLTAAVAEARSVLLAHQISFDES